MSIGSMTRIIGPTYPKSIGLTYLSAWDNSGMKQSVLDRALIAMRHAGEPTKQGDVARLAGIKQPSVNLWRTGLPSMESAVRFCKATGVAVDWLLTGRGDMLPPVEMAGDLRELAGMWPDLDPEARGRILDIARGFAAYSRSIAFTGDPERRTAVHEQIEQYQATHQESPAQRPSKRRKPKKPRKSK